MAENDSETSEEAYDLGGVETDDIPNEWQGGAVYTLEQAVRCPHCRDPIRTLRVVRMLRTQVTFTSPLPRAGRALICPSCERIVSAELSGIL
jgi:hypothetical protein